MKLKLFGKEDPTVLALTLLAGGYDLDHGRVSIVVRCEEDRAGTLTLDIGEARRLAEMLLLHTPEVAKVASEAALRG